MFQIVSAAELAALADGVGIEGSLGVIYQLRDTGAYYTWNPTTSEMIGLSADEVLATRALAAGDGQQVHGIDLLSPTNGVTPTFSGTASGISGAAATVNGERWWRITVTGSGYVEVNIPTFTALTADAMVIEYIADPTTVQVIAPYLGTAGYATFASYTYTLPTAVSNQDWRIPTAHAAAYISSADWTKNSYTRATYEQQWVISKLRVTFLGAGTFYLRSIRVGGGQRKGRICVLSDDGYDSWILRGEPTMVRYGVPSTIAVIPSLVGTAGYASLAQLQAFVGSGNACVGHGPDGGPGNLFTRWSTDAEALADMVYTKSYLRANDLADARGAACYVWPQGIYTRTAGDMSFLASVQSAGFLLARGVDHRSIYPNIRSTSSNCLARLVMPTIGHTYAGATNTADDATETTNINAIVARIQALGSNRADGFLMLHKVVGRGAATAGNIEIEVDRLATLAAAIQTEVVAGRLVACTMPEMLSQTLPRQIVPA